MKIALINMCSEKGDLNVNFSRLEYHVSAARKLGAGIIVFPEMTITGYFDDERVAKYALNKESKYCQKVSKLTENNDLTIIFGIAEKENDKLYITQFVAEGGQIIGKYRKQNIVDKEARVFHPGSNNPIFEKDSLKYGLTICADIDLPKLYSSYAKNGCYIIFECASPDLYGDRDKRDWLSGYNWWRNNCIEKIGKYSKDYKIKVAVATQSGRNSEDDFPGGAYLFTQDGKIISETKDYKQEILIIEI